MEETLKRKRISFSFRRPLLLEMLFLFIFFFSSSFSFPSFLIMVSRLSMDKWYKGVYRRNLVDMHINDTKKVYLSRFNAEKYFEYLKEAHIQSPMIYLQSHTGLCNFETKVGKTHRFFKENPLEMKKLISLCQEDGMKVVGYYSLIFNNQAVYDHPSWEMVDKEGKTWREHGQRYGLACPNNEEYRSFLKEQLQELAKEFPTLDGLFFDMPYWEVLCHCPSCQKRFQKEYGKALPETLDWDNETWKSYVEARQKWMVDFVSFVRNEAHKLLPNTTIEFNFAAVVGCDYLAGSTEGINEECEFTGGDLYGDLYNHSFVAKYYRSITKNQPFEYMTCRCNKNLREHTINKSETQLESEVLLTTMEHGASLIIDAINPDGTLDKRVSRRLGKVFKKEMAYEPYLEEGTPYSEVAVFFDSKTQYEYHHRLANKKLAIQVNRTLIEHHIPFAVLGHGALKELSKYQLLVLPGLLSLDEEERKAVIEYVKEGGNLYLSGDSDPVLLKTFFDGEIVGETFGNSPYPVIYKGYDEVKAYLYPTTQEAKKSFGMFDKKYPLPVTYKIPLFDAKNAKILAKIALPYTDPDNNNEFASIHSNPPGVWTNQGALFENTYGKGHVLYSAALIEGDNRENFKEVLLNLWKPYIKPRFVFKGSSYIDFIVFEKKDGYLINLFDLNFVNDLVTRSFELSLPDGNYKVRELLSKKELPLKGKKVKGRFKKYLALEVIKSY